MTLGGTVNATTEPGTLAIAGTGITVINGLTLTDGTVVQIGNANFSGEIAFHGLQTVGGTGEFQFIGHSGEFDVLDNTLTLGPGIILHALNTPLDPNTHETINNPVIYMVGGKLVDEATVQLDGGDTLSFNGNPGTSWSDGGPITVTNSFLYLGDTFTLAAGSS